MADLKDMSIGMVFDLGAVVSGDYVRQATQDDIDRLLGGEAWATISDLPYL